MGHSGTLISPEPGSDVRALKEVPVTTRRHARLAGTLFALVAIIASAISSTYAQDATPVAQPVAPPVPPIFTPVIVSSSATWLSR
jgi:hypothetical protein